MEERLGELGPPLQSARKRANEIPPAIREPHAFERTLDAPFEICPAQAVLKGDRIVRFNYDACIRCFCCMEVCPEGAIKPAGKLGERLAHAYLRLRRQKMGESTAAAEASADAPQLQGEEGT